MLAVVACALAPISGAAAASRDAVLPWACPATFAGLGPGWTRSDLGPTPMGNWPASTASWASTGRTALLADVPRGGVYVWALLGRSAGGAKDLLPVRFTRPRLARMRLTMFPKGPPGRGFQRVRGRLGRMYDVDLQVIYAQRRPSRRTIARAQEAVDSLRFPRWPRFASSPPCD